MNIHEYLSFNKPALSAAITDRIRDYCAKWIELLNENVLEELKIELVADGKPVNGISEMQKALQNLTSADAFSIDVLAGCLNDEDTGDLYHFLDEIKETEDITYKVMTFSEKYAEFKCCYIADGESGSLLDRAVENAALEEQMDWYSWDCSLWTEFDFDGQKAMIDRLHGLVRKYLPAEQIAVAEAEWTGENAEPGALIPDLQWVVSDLKEVAAFLNEVNGVLFAIDGNYEIKADGLWFDLEHFAAAQWQIEDKQVKLVSAKL